MPVLMRCSCGRSHGYRPHEIECQRTNCRNKVEHMFILGAEKYQLCEMHFQGMVEREDIVSSE